MGPTKTPSIAQMRLSPAVVTPTYSTRAPRRLTCSRGGDHHSASAEYASKFAVRCGTWSAASASATSMRGSGSARSRSLPYAIAPTIRGPERWQSEKDLGDKSPHRPLAPLSLVGSCRTIGRTIAIARGGAAAYHQFALMKCHGRARYASTRRELVPTGGIEPL